MPKFDHSKPYGKVYGEDKAHYWQNGVSYDNHFEPIGDFPDEVEEPADNEILDKVPEPAPDVDEDKIEEEAADEPDYQAMPWQGVKKLVEAAGGTWSNKLDGVEFLRSK